MFCPSGRGSVGVAAGFASEAAPSGAGAEVLLAVIEVSARGGVDYVPFHAGVRLEHCRSPASRHRDRLVRRWAACARDGALQV